MGSVLMQYFNGGQVSLVTSSANRRKSLLWVRGTYCICFIVDYLRKRLNLFSHLSDEFDSALFYSQVKDRVFGLVLPNLKEISRFKGCNFVKESRVVVRVEVRDGGRLRLETGVSAGDES